MFSIMIASGPPKRWTRHALATLEDGRGDGQTHSVQGGARKPVISVMVASGCSSISQWPEFSTDALVTLLAAKPISAARLAP